MLYSPDKGLNIKKFSEMTEEWLQFVVNCRLGLKHDYGVGMIFIFYDI